jgi:solute carrier family 13 (sodium-dependent dicarboxylate transporter), member 2/3/5
VAAYMRAAVEPLLGGLSEYAFVFVMSLTVIAMTAVLSNMVTLTMLLPLGMTIAKALGVADPVAIGVVVGIGISLDYSLPSGTTTNAIVAGSGYLRVATMIRYGVPLSVIHAVLLTFVGYPLAKLVMGH